MVSPAIEIVSGLKALDFDIEAADWTLVGRRLRNVGVEE